MLRETRMTRRLGLISLTLFLLLNFTPALAWKLVQTRGTVTVTLNKKIQKIKVGQQLFNGAIIHTGKNSRARLRQGSSSITLGSSTRYQVGLYKKSPGHLRMMQFLCLRCTFLHIVGRLPSCLSHYP